MRAFIFTLLLFIGCLGFSQINTPRFSPATEIKQMVGLTEIEVQYSRPSKRGREIFGNLVPYDKIWRTGADNSTKISFTTDVMVDGNTIKAGTYSIFSIPNQNEWTVMFYSDVELWGVPRDWSDDKIVFSSNYKVNKINPVETFTISFDDLTNNDVNMSISWEKSSVDIKIDVPTRSMVEKDINNVLNDNPKASDYYAAAVFYRQENVNLSQALLWMNKAIEMFENPRFYHYRQQSLLMAANNKFSDAIDAANKSLDDAIKADNQSYVKMNRRSIDCLLYTSPSPRDRG